MNIAIALDTPHRTTKITDALDSQEYFRKIRLPLQIDPQFVIMKITRASAVLYDKGGSFDLKTVGEYYIEQQVCSF